MKNVYLIVSCNFSGACVIAAAIEVITPATNEGIFYIILIKLKSIK
jgi:hypothetical protein